MIYFCKSEHPNECVYAENIVEFLTGEGIQSKVLQLAADGDRPQLKECLHKGATAVVGVNSLLDHSWIATENFLDLAERNGVPVIHWVLDHPTSRWPEFGNATLANSRFLFVSQFSDRYFRRFIMPAARSSWTFNTGPSRHSRALDLNWESFAARQFCCLIPMHLTRIGGAVEQVRARIERLDVKLASAIKAAIDSAKYDLDNPIEVHLLAALGQGEHPPTQVFNAGIQIVEEAVQIFRRLRIFEVARDFPVLIQSDSEAVKYSIEGAKATLLRNVDMVSTCRRMQESRAVVSTSFANDMLHMRTLNGLNAGCTNVIESNLMHRQLFAHGRDALLFRYDDDSLRECFTVVCEEPDRAFAIAQAGFARRDHYPFRFGGFGNILSLAAASCDATQRPLH